MPEVQSSPTIPRSVLITDHFARLNITQQTFDAGIHKLTCQWRQEALSRDPLDWWRQPVEPARITPVPRWFWDALSVPLNWEYHSVQQYDGQIHRVRTYDLHDLRAILDLLGLAWTAKVDPVEGVIELDVLGPLEVRRAS